VRRIILVLLAAVLVPSLALGVLALRAASQQREILERQTAALHQQDVDGIAASLRDAILRLQRDFAEQVRVALGRNTPRALAGTLPAVLGENLGGTPFAVAADGSLVSPSDTDESATRFLREHEDFLSNRARATVFPAQQSLGNNFAVPNPRPQSDSKLASSFYSTTRNLAPAQNARAQSRSNALVSDFQTATSGESDGLLARYTSDGLELILWSRPPEADGMLYGLALPPAAVRQFACGAFDALSPGVNGACVALLDENARPVTQSIPNFSATWRRPFVASEIGETLPHWEVALYLLDPASLDRSARVLALTLTALIAVALAVIFAGGAFVALDARRQLVLARKKTDFVSNVSHELKTPLTAIRMFSELLGRESLDFEKRGRYARILTLESERLTRLIDNVLDFARLERQRKPLQKSTVDLHQEIARVWEMQSERLREAGFACEWLADPPPYRATANTDAIAQALVNLLSNAEKYAAAGREITLLTRKDAGMLRVSVLDRGPGVPRGEERRIFEAFHRADDSLASGVQGSGLGLALARRIATDHGGEIVYRPREGGGSEFILQLPLIEP
jgi:signal transduction histidine kinase